MNDAQKRAAWWLGVVTGRQAGTPSADLDFARGVDRSLDDLAPKTLPKRPPGVPTAGELEAFARDGGKGGPWLADFVAWRLALEAAEQTNAGALDAVYGAAEAAGRHGDAVLVRRLLQFAAEVYGHRGVPPVGVLERRRASVMLTRNLDVLGLRARTVAWQAPAATETRAGMGMRREARPW